VEVLNTVRTHLHDFLLYLATRADGRRSEMSVAPVESRLTSKPRSLDCCGNFIDKATSPAATNKRRLDLEKLPSIQQQQKS